MAAAERPAILPVAAGAALAWAAGRLDDKELILSAPLAPEAVFIANLPGIGAFPLALRLMAFWRQRGALFVITRTNHPIVARQLARWGGRIIHQEAVKGRWVVPPEGFARCIDRFVSAQADKPLSPDPGTSDVPGILEAASQPARIAGA